MAALNFPASPTTGQVYTANGRSWLWNGTAWISNNNAIAPSYAAKTSSYSIASSDYTIGANATSGAITITLPDATLLSGQIFIVKKTDSSANAVTIATTSSQTIDGASTFVLRYQYQSIMVQSTGTSWVLLGGNIVATWQAI